MTLYKPDFAHSDVVQEFAMQYGCTERATEEVLQYARTLAARKMPLEMVLSATARYAKIRGNEDAEYET